MIECDFDLPDGFEAGKEGSTIYLFYYGSEKVLIFSFNAPLAQEEMNKICKEILKNVK